MSLTRKDLAATGLTLLVVLVFMATHEGWGVPMIGGIATCGQGSPARGRATALLALLGALALGLTVLALATGSLMALSLLVVDIVVLWAVPTARHASHAPHKTVAA